MNSSYQQLQPDGIREIVSYIRQFRTGDEPFDVLVSGNTTGTEHQKDADMILPYAEAGATWVQDGFMGDEGELEALRTRIRQGPPSLK